MSTRRIKRSPLRDVAGMLRSFHYASHAALFHQLQAGVVRQKDLPLFVGWTQFWVHWVSAEFLRSYLSEDTAPINTPSPTYASSTSGAVT